MFQTNLNCAGLSETLGAILCLSLLYFSLIQLIHLYSEHISADRPSTKILSVFKLNESKLSMLVPSLAGTGLILAVWGSRVDLSDFITLVTSSPPEGSPTPSIPCMLTRYNLGWKRCLASPRALVVCVANHQRVQIRAC